MKLKFNVSPGELSALASEIQALYTKVDGSDNYQLNVDGAVATERLAEFRDTNIALKKQLASFEGIDPAIYKDLQTLKQKVDSKTLVEADGVDAAVKARTEKMSQEHNAAMKDLQEKFARATQMLDDHVVGNALTLAATQGGVQAPALHDALNRGKVVFRNQDGVAVALDQKGNVIYGADGENPLTPSEWVKTVLRKDAPHLFMPSSGGGAPGGSSAASVKNMSPAQLAAEGLRARGST